VHNRTHPTNLPGRERYSVLSEFPYFIILVLFVRISQQKTYLVECYLLDNSLIWAQQDEINHNNSRDSRFFEQLISFG
jgi:hypothetical protein